MKKIFLVILFLGLFGGSVYYFYEPESEEVKQSPEVAEVRDYKNIAYEIEGESVLLKDGKSEQEFAIVEYFGNEVRGDMNGDGREDVAFLLTQIGEGTGNFYYVVVALAKTDGGYNGTNAVILGDRIAPQTTEFRNGELIVNYADRKPDEPMTVDPSVGVSKYLNIVDGKLVEVEK